MTVAVVIVNYHSEDLLKECLRALYRLEIPDLSTIVVDNSAPSCDQAFQAAFRSTTFLPQEENRGFAAGANVGIRHALCQGADYICLLNPDTSFSEDFLTPLITILEKNQDLGLASPRIMTGQNNATVWYAGGDISWLKGGPRHHYDSPHEDVAFHETEFATGCCMLIRRRVLEKGPLLPEFYFVYFEDADFSLSIRKSGWRLAYCPDCEIHHQVSATTRYRSPAYVYYFARNRIWFMRRWASAPRFIIFCFTNTFFRLPAALVSFTAVDRKPALIKAFLTGFLHGFTISPENGASGRYVYGSMPKVDN